MRQRRRNAFRPCACGRMPKSIAVQVGEDCVETQVICDCGARGPAYEHWRADHENAIYAWNCGDREAETPTPAAGQESPVGCAAEHRRSGHQCPNNQPREPK